MQIIKRKKKSGESYPFVRFGIKKMSWNARFGIIKYMKFFFLINEIQ